MATGIPERQRRRDHQAKKPRAGKTNIGPHPANATAAQSRVGTPKNRHRLDTGVSYGRDRHQAIKGRPLSALLREGGSPDANPIAARNGRARGGRGRGGCVGWGGAPLRAAVLRLEFLATRRYLARRI